MAASLRNLILVLFLFLAREASAISTTIIAPDGGECLEVGKSYDVKFSWSGNIAHVALYYRADGQQPSHLDTSVIQHPQNVPNPGSPFKWTPEAGDISETGRVWIDGHDNNHDSLNTWDSSNANFAVRSSCAPPPGTPLRTFRPPSAPGGFDKTAKVIHTIVSTSSARFRFESPWAAGKYKVTLWERRGDFYYDLEFKELSLEPGGVVEFEEENLAENQFYDFGRNTRELFIKARDLERGFESLPSEVVPSFWTALGFPRKIEVRDLTATSAVLEITEPSPIPNFLEGRSQAYFVNLIALDEELEKEEVTTATSSGWISTTTWFTTGLEPDTDYQFWAKLRNGGGEETPFGALVTIRTPPLAAHPDYRGETSIVETVGGFASTRRTFAPAITVASAPARVQTPSAQDTYRICDRKGL